MKRRVVVLPTGVAAYLQDRTGQVSLSLAVQAYLAGRVLRAGLCETYAGDGRHRVKIRSAVKSKTLVTSVMCDANRQGVTIRLPSRGIW